MRASFALVVLVFSGCDDDPELIDGVFTTAEWEKLAMHSPLTDPPPDPTNAYADNPAAATLGQKLFFESSHSGPLAVANDGTNGGLGAAGETGKVSCASCHNPTGWLSDKRSNPSTVALGADWGIRNAMSVVDVAYQTPFQHWDGRFDTTFGPAIGPAENAKSQNSTRLAIAHMLWNKYRDEYNAVFDPDLDPALDPLHVDAARFPAVGKPKAMATDPDGPWEMMTAADRTIVSRIFINWAKAIAAHLRRVRSGETPFDRYIAGNDGAITAAAKRGAKLFIGKAACSDCHTGPAFTDNLFHNTGVAQVGERVPAMDDGRFAAVMPLLGHGFNSSSAFSDNTATGRLDGLAPDEVQRGAFLTPMLRNCTETGPYMHAGQLATLEEVIELYDRGGEETGFSGTKDEKMKVLNLTAAEKLDLVEFLRTLDGPDLDPALLVNTANP
jgi:cytochrome c peroxidase